MKKRLLSMLLALVMVLSMLPVTALAAEVVSVTVYRDPVVDYVTTTDQKDFFNYIKRDISNETVNAWYKTIYNSVLGEIPSSGSITYYVSTLDGYYDVNGTWAAYFGHAAVAGGNASKDTEKVIVKADTEYEAKVTVKGYIDVAFEIVEEVFSTKVSLGDSNKITNGYTFEKALNDANAAAKTKESVLNEESQFIQYEFLGWDKDGNGTVDAIDTSKVTTSNAAERDGDTYTAIYKKSYLITWVDEDGTELDSEYVAEGDTPSYDGTPTKEGWTFSAWSPEIKAVTEAATYTATYTQNAADEVTVTFDSNGGSSVKSQTVTVGEKAEEPEEPTKEGYTFEGWLLDGVKFDFSTPVTQDITLTADWKAITYTVTLDYNNGEANGEETVTYGDTLSIDDPTWEGYTFEGWYTEDDKPYDDEAIKEDVTLTAHWSTTPKVKLSEDSITITYGENVKLRNVLDGVYVGDNAIDAKGKVGFDTEIDELPVGEHTVDVAFEGYTENGITYNDSSAKLTVIVNKATANVTVNSQTIKYSELGDMLPLVEKDNVKTIDLLAGLDVHDETYLLGTVQIDMGLSEEEIALIGSVLRINPNDLSLDDFKKLLGAVADRVDSVAGLLEDTDIDADTIKSLIDTLQSIQDQLAMDSELRIQIVDEISAENIGVYLVGSVIADNNYETALDAGYLIITPNGLKAELSWKETDDNDIITLSKLEGFELGAEVELIDSTLEGADASVEEAEKHLEYYFIGVDANGELLLEQTMTEEVGVYAQIAYIANWDNEMYYAVPIARPIIVAPNVADVAILDENGNENYARAFTYDGSPKSVTVTVDGNAAPVEGLTVKYIGSDTRVDGWYREEAPTESGVYTVVAIYTENDDNGKLVKAGGAVGVMVIEPADAEYTMEDTQVCPDGEEHFADITSDMNFDYLTIAIDRENNIAYVNLPDDTAEHVDRIVSLLPSDAENALTDLLAKYAEFDGDVQSETLKTEINDVLQTIIDADTSAKAVEYAEKLVDKIASELESNEEIQALVEKLQTELDTIQSELEAKIPDELEEYIKKIVSVADSSIDVDVDKVESDVKALLDQLKDSIPEEVYNELYEAAEDLIAAVKNNSTVQDLKSEVENILAKVEELESVDAETIVKGILGAAAGAINGEELAAIVEEVVAKVEARGYVDYATDLLKDVASMYKGEVDVDSYVEAVKAEAESLLETVKNKAASGDISMDDLEDVETYVDNILAKLQEMVDKIPEGTIIFGSNPSEEGEYDCYAMNISANYKPNFQSATLIIGHDMVYDVLVPSTCTVPGVKAGGYCKNCDYKEGYGELPLADHSWGTEWVDNEDGTHSHICSACGCASEGETHNWSDWGENGRYTHARKCDDCGAKETGNHEWSETAVKLDDSYHKHTCELCGVGLLEAHVMGDWYTTKTATTTREGEKRRDCAHCDYYETETIPMIEEDDDWYVPEVEKEPEGEVRYLNTVDHVSYIVGYEDGTVRPDDDITRAEVATIYFRLLEEKVRDKYWSTKNPYDDVTVDDWFNTAVSTLYKLGVIVDCKDEFRPNEPITRAELAVMAAQFADIDDVERCSFDDVSRKYWAADEIAIVEAMGWIEGYPDGTYRPDECISRAETVTIINRMLERAVKQDDMHDDMVTFSDNPTYEWYYEEIQEAANSHKYKRTKDEVSDDGYYYERWTRILEAPDWVLIEQSWYAKHIA